MMAGEQGTREKGNAQRTSDIKRYRLRRTVIITGITLWRITVYWARASRAYAATGSLSLYVPAPGACGLSKKELKAYAQRLNGCQL